MFDSGTDDKKYSNVYEDSNEIYEMHVDKIHKEYMLANDDINDNEDDDEYDSDGKAIDKKKQLNDPRSRRRRRNLHRRRQ